MISLNSPDFYTSPVKSPKDRSVANIPFVTPSQDLDAKFVKEADALGFKNIKVTEVLAVCVPVFTMPFHVKVF